LDASKQNGTNANCQGHRSSGKAGGAVEGQGAAVEVRGAVEG